MPYNKWFFKKFSEKEIHVKGEGGDRSRRGINFHVLYWIGRRKSPAPPLQENKIVAVGCSSLGDRALLESPIVSTQVTQMFSCSCCFFFSLFCFFLPDHFPTSYHQCLWSGVASSSQFICWSFTQCLAHDQLIRHSTFISQSLSQGSSATCSCLINHLISPHHRASSVSPTNCLFLMNHAVSGFVLQQVAHV